MVKVVNATWYRESIVSEIRRIGAQFPKVVVAFSGGMDSTAALFFALLALGRDKVMACTIDWGKYLPEKARSHILFLVNYFGVKHQFLPGEKDLERVAQGGPSCNLCTKKAKLTKLKNFFGGRALIMGGANQSDSWGKRGMQFFGNTYSPLFHLEKEEIQYLADSFRIPILRLGENVQREGCLLKHLLKPLASPYHGEAVVKSNELLWRILDKEFPHRNIANVKIIGPLRENCALINVQPLPPLSLREKIEKALLSLPQISRVTWIDQPATLTIRANPGLYNHPEARYWLERGRLQPDFAFPIRVSWLLSTNRRLRTFQVIDCLKGAV